MSKTTITTIAFGALAAPATFAILAAATAHADTHVCIGGYGDPTSQGLANAKAQQGDPCDVPIQWPASLGLPGEPTNMQGSLNVAVPAAVDAYYQAGGGDGAPVTIEGWSLGAPAASQAGDAIRIQNGGTIPTNLQVVTDGNVYGASGMANDPGIAGLAFHVGSPFVGAPQSVPQMGKNLNDINDPWGDSANQWPQTQIADIASVQWNHYIPDPAAPHDTYVTHDPVTGADVQNEVYGVGENPVSAAAERNGTPVPPPVDGFFDGFFPVNNPADPGPNANFAPEPMPMGNAFPAAGGPVTP